jgi:hypothetical protein
MRKERKSRAKKSSASKAGRRRVIDPRRTNHLMLYRSEREACDARADRLGLGFSTWARSLLLASLAEELAAGKVPSGSAGHTMLVLGRAIMRELRDLPEGRRQVVVDQWVAAFASLDETKLPGIELLGGGE